MSEPSGVEQVKKKIVTLTNDLEKFREKATKCEKDAKDLRDRAEKVSYALLEIETKCFFFMLQIILGRKGERELQKSVANFGKRTNAHY